jgi:hypothetical protein
VKSSAGRRVRRGHWTRPLGLNTPSVAAPSSSMTPDEIETNLRQPGQGARSVDRHVRDLQEGGSTHAGDCGKPVGCSPPQPRRALARTPGRPPSQHGFQRYDARCR